MVREQHPPLVVIVGPTASGKSALAMEVARLFDGEIICADSRTIYRGADIGTAKPSSAERSEIPHHLLDVIDVDQRFSVAEFKKMANNVIGDIVERGKLPIMVGGTGLYIDSVIFDYQFTKTRDQQTRARLESKSIEELQQEIRSKGYDLPTNYMNRRHLIGVIERRGMTGAKSELRSNTLVIGMDVDPEVLRGRIRKRSVVMIQAGLADECIRLIRRHGADAPGLQAPAYKAFTGHVNGSQDVDESLELFIANDTKLAKRQRTWFRRNKSIHWVKNREESIDLVTTFLNKSSFLSSRKVIQ